MYIITHLYVIVLLHNQFGGGWSNYLLLLCVKLYSISYLWIANKTKSWEVWSQAWPVFWGPRMDDGQTGSPKIRRKWKTGCQRLSAPSVGFFTFVLPPRERLAESGLAQARPNETRWCHHSTADWHTAYHGQPGPPRDRLGQWGGCSGPTNYPTSSSRLCRLSSMWKSKTGSPCLWRDAPDRAYTPSWGSSMSDLTPSPVFPSWRYWPPTGMERCNYWTCSSPSGSVYTLRPGVY